MVFLNVKAIPPQMIRVLTCNFSLVPEACQRIYLVEHVLNELNLVGNLGTTEDGQEGSLGRFEHLGKVLELLLHQEAGGTLGKLNADHGGVGSVGSTEASCQLSSCHENDEHTHR